MATFTIKQGDTEPKLRVLLRGADGAARVIADTDSVTFAMSPAAVGAGELVQGDATVNAPEAGDVQFDWPDGAPAAALYRAEFTVTSGDALTRETFPQDGYLTVRVEPKVA